MELILLLLVGVLLLLVGTPIWAIFKIHRFSEKIEKLELRLRMLERSAAQPEPFASPEPEPNAPEPPPEPVPPFATPTAEPPIVAFEPPAEAPPQYAYEEGPPGPEARPRYSEPDLTPSLPTIDWEQFMGVKLLAWVGGLALFIGVAFFLKYSFEHDLVPPELRVAAGFLTGLGLIVGGVLLSRKQFTVTAHTLCATGIVILYAVTFACRSIYEFAFFTQAPTFLLMVLITATAFLLAVRLDALVVAVLGILGGFLTPVLLSTGHDNPVGLFTYIALLDAGLIAVALHRRWNFLALLGAAGTILMQAGWALKFFEVEKLHIAAAVLLGFSLLFLFAFYLAHRWERMSNWIAAAALALPANTFAFAFYFLSLPALAHRPGIVFGLVFAIDLCVLAAVLISPRLFPAHLGSGVVAFLLLATWTLGSLNAELLNWALAFYLLFAALHSVFPIVLQRLRPDVSPVWWSHLFPPLALLLTMAPILKFTAVSFLVWPFILLVDLLAIGLAVVTGSIFSIVMVLVLTLLVTAIWLFRIPTELSELPLSLVLIGGFAVFFFAAGIFATRKIVARAETSAAPPDSDAPTLAERLFGPGPFSSDAKTQIPALSAILPFLLLILVTLRMPLQNPSPVFGLALLLVILLFGVTRAFGQDWLPAVGLASVLALEHAWHAHHFNPAFAVIPLGWFVLFIALFAVFPFLFFNRFADRVVPWAVAALAFPLHFYLVHRVISAAYPNQLMGLLPAAFALPPLLGLIVLLRKSPADEHTRLTQLAWFGGVTLFFVTLIFPIQFERQWITIGWALEGVALLWLFHRVPHSGLRFAGALLLAVAFVRLALNPAVFDYHPRSAAPIFNWYLYAYGAVIACLFAGARLLAPPRDLLFGRRMPPVLNTLATVLAFLLLNIEIADYFSEGTTLTFQFSGNLARGMTYTIAWALFAFVLLLAGILKKMPAARYAALGLLSVTLVKLFFHDLANLKQLYRIGALICVAIIAILASFVYQKFLGAAPPAPGNRRNEETTPKV